MTPVDSWPSRVGTFCGRPLAGFAARWIWCSCEWQMPAAKTLTSTWSGAGSGMSTSSTTRGSPGLARMAARPVVLILECPQLPGVVPQDLSLRRLVDIRAAAEDLDAMDLRGVIVVPK